MKEPGLPNKLALNLKSYGLAIAVHVIVLGIVLFNLFWNPAKKIELGSSQPQPIQAQVVDQNLLDQELDKIVAEQQAEQREALEKQQKLEQLEQQALLKKQEIEKLEAEKKQKSEQAEAQALKAQQLAEQRERRNRRSVRLNKNASPKRPA